MASGGGGGREGQGCTHENWKKWIMCKYYGNNHSSFFTGKLEVSGINLQMYFVETNLWIAWITCAANLTGCHCHSTKHRSKPCLPLAKRALEMNWQKPHNTMFLNYTKNTEIPLNFPQNLNTKDANFCATFDDFSAVASPQYDSGSGVPPKPIWRPI